MTLNLMFGSVWLLFSLYMVAAKGVGAAFAFCYLPAIMLFRPIKGYMLNTGLPEFSAANATVIALSVGLIFLIGTRGKIRWSLLDTIILIAPVIAIISGATTENGFHTGYNEFVKQYCGWLIPYFVARYAFKSDLFREQFLKMLIFCVIVLLPFVLIELRMWPHFYAMTLIKFGLSVATDLRAETRLGLFRTTASFTHPIFFGDGCVSMIGILLVLGYTTRIGLKNFWVRAALAAAAIALFSSLSFGPFAAAALAGSICYVLWRFRFSRWMLVPMTLIAITAVAALTFKLATEPMPDRPHDGTIADSFWVRRLIVQNSYKLVETAGWLGHGRLLQGLKLDLDSVDNAYMLFAMCRGWLYAGLWVAIPLCVGLRVSKAMRRLKHSQVHIFPLAVGASTVMGVSFAFYWVWAGWAGEPYTMLWLILMAFTMSASDYCLEPIQLPADSAQPQSAQRYAASPGALAGYGAIRPAM